MRDVKGMSANDMLTEIENRKVEAFDMFLIVNKWTTQQLSLSGYSKATDVLNFAHKMNEARMKEWEKFHG